MSVSSMDIETGAEAFCSTPTMNTVIIKDESISEDNSSENLGNIIILFIYSVLKYNNCL